MLNSIPRRAATTKSDIVGSDPVKVEQVETTREVLPSAVMETNYVTLGREAWERLKATGDRSWDDWMDVGAALTIGRMWAMEKAHAKGPSGKGYNVAFSHWLSVHGFDKIDSTDRSRLLAIMESRPEIEAWRATLTPEQRASWNAPSTVWRISRCPDRGLERFRRNGDGTSGAEPDSNEHAAKETPAKETSSEKQPAVKDRAGSWAVAVNKSVGVARDARSFRGDVTPALLEAVRDASNEWSKTLADFEGRRRDQESFESATTRRH